MTRLSRLLRPASQHLAVAVVAFLAVLLGWRLLHSNGGVASEINSRSTPAAREFVLPSVRGTGSVDLHSYAGRLVVLAFWASWCSPCKAELPELERLWRVYRSGPVVVLGLDVHDSVSDARSFIKAHKLSFPLAVDSSDRTLDAYGVQALPELFFISPDGRVVEHFRGLVPPARIEGAIHKFT